MNEELFLKIKKYALWLLGKREYSVFGLREKLEKKFLDEFDLIETVIKEFQEKEWVSDIRFCENFIREKAEYSGWGRRKIFMKIKEKGIDSEMAEEMLERFFSYQQEKNKAIDLALEKYKTVSKKTENTFEQKQKILAFLAGRGFSYSLAQEAIEDMFERLRSEEVGL